MKTPASLHHSAMLQEPKPFWRRLSDRLFKHLELHPENVQELRELTEQGQIVYWGDSKYLITEESL